ncbi:DUF2252 domain-containing protein [Alloacidobacterium sp.]|uniref:DUF2252 domain-containing protein n=1 Tax=Alloacidobacterium sp. TaxID=2951999 RepID=UPI002D563608|nr:DUF2252 domain-containing protein [Alloacidobacterium sp.]HYK37445.1 DUF2252 domain-containing protein [Alloacidobacterium sp.]
MANTKQMASANGKKANPAKFEHIGIYRFGGPNPEVGIDLSKAIEPWQQRRELGQELRKRIPREMHAKWTPPKNRPSPLDLLAQSNRGRQAHLVPLRMGRMAASPFGFLRGSACVMANDLSTTPISGIPVVMDGDAHINNFGFFGTPQRDLVFDLNDFDETTIGPWEYDLKRLTASVNVAGRENGLNARERKDAVLRCVQGYRWNLDRLQSMGVLDVWYLHAYPGRKNPLAKVDPKTEAILRKSVDKAMSSTNMALLSKVAVRDVTGTWHLREDPPILTPVSKEIRDGVVAGLKDYAQTLSPERRFLLSRFHVVDVGHRVVGVGSVGTRAYLALLMGNCDQDPLFLQIKEAIVPAHAPYVPTLTSEFNHQGKRIVIGQRALQASSDIFLGWTTIHGRPYYVRQMKNMKGGVPIEWLSGESFYFIAWACGSILGRAHARTSEPAVLAGYCGNSKVLDEALADWAEAYGDQTEADHATLVKAIKSGKVKAQTNGIAE